MSATVSSSEPFSTEGYFHTQRPPAGLEEKSEKMHAFVEQWKAVKGKKVVLVTVSSPAFSILLIVIRAVELQYRWSRTPGTRGATSAEYFLSQGYAVIFLHRLHSLRPFSRHYSHSLNPFLDLLSIVPSSSSSSSSIVVSPEHTQTLLPILKAYHESQSSGTLLSVEFQTVNDYLWLLKAVTASMASLGRRGMYYLAAAVSDFFLPEEKVAEHKIQSNKGTLSLEMDQVPKVMRPLVQEWTPEGYIVSFKLETDTALLIPKSRAALSRYGHQLVIGNELHRRKHEVVFVERATPSSKGTGDDQIKGSVTPPIVAGSDLGVVGFPRKEEYKETWLRLDDLKNDGHAGGKGRDGEVEIEEMIVKELLNRHQYWMDAKATRE
ncbi:uncharacterized protein IL334_005417 [Kwoniella shivajii]|uniref:DNA/pantothenate metabolism flavoprotein C-terminal domain-containing protein n=1 Tax=Kwoniella shivajii TaxID=564305 RepID=A0ABZ1D336_9TREE|nr:hypothetical protein IL334_005417 [Kwoniella shivajii]